MNYNYRFKETFNSFEDETSCMTESIVLNQTPFQFL